MTAPATATATAVTADRGNAWGRAARRLGGAIAATYREGGRAFVAAPLLVAIVVVPEALQHVAEIRLGMFDSRDAARVLQNDPTRWAFGYAKVAGFLISILLLARYVALGSVRAAMQVRPATLLRVLLAVALTVAAAWPFEQLQARTTSLPADLALGTVSALIQAGLTLYLVGALLDDRTLSLRAAFAERWPTALVLCLLVAAVFIPCQALHSANHLWALGRPDAVVWALMAFDSLWIGLMAALLGAALAVGHRSRLTWKGWGAARETE